MTREALTFLVALVLSAALVTAYGSPAWRVQAEVPHADR